MQRYRYATLIIKNRVIHGFLLLIDSLLLIDILFDIL